MDPTSVRHRAVQAYIYGYPLVLMEISKKTMTNVEKPDPLTFRAPINQFGKGDDIPGPEFRGVVSPNVDTLYTSAWLDVAEEPVVLHVPDTHGRYYLMPMLDGWTNVFAAPGKRTTGTGEGDFAITGPNWRGSLPDGVRQLRSPTDTVWILGRTQLNGPSDLPAVHELVARYTLRPLSGYGEGTHTPPPGKADPAISSASPPAQVEQMDARTFFSHLAIAMRANPPAPADAPMVATLAGLGIRPGRPFDADTLGETTAEALDQAPAEAQKQIKAGVAALGEDVNGWRYAADLGSYGTDYLRRGHRLAGPGRQPAPGRHLPADLRRRREAAAERRPPVRHPLRTRPDSAGQRVLVDHDLRRPGIPDRKPHRPVRDRAHGRAGRQRGRVGGSVHPARPWRGRTRFATCTAPGPRPASASCTPTTRRSRSATT